MIKYYVIAAITFLVAVAGLISKINDVISVPHNIREIFRRIFRKSEGAGFSYYFESQESLIESKLRGYCDRVVYDEHNNLIPDVSAILRDSCDIKKSGYIYFEGKRRTGKTVLAAHLSRKLNAPHHFVSIQESRDDKGLIVKSLIEQICRKMKSKCPNLSSNDELDAILGSTLALFSKYAVKKKRSQFIVLDGIDTLEDGRLENLPEYLPKGVYIIAVCEKIPDDGGLRRFTLQRFTYPETKAVLAKTELSEAEINEVHDRLDGNPYTIGFFSEHFQRETDIDEQLKEAASSLKIEQILRKIPKEDMSFMLFLSTAFGPIPLNDILDILKIERLQAESIIENEHSYILDDKSGIMLIDDEIKRVLEDDDFLTSDEERQRREFHENIISHFERKDSEYSEKYLIYHYHQTGMNQKIPDLLSMETTKNGVFEERRRFVISLIHKDKNFDPLFLDIIRINNSKTWEYIFSSMKYIVDNRKDFSCLRRIIDLIDKEVLGDYERGIVSYYEAVCMRKEGKIEEALNQLEEIDLDSVRPKFDIWILIQQADCAREIGRVMKADELYSKIIESPDFKADHPQEYWECQLKIIDRKYCNGLYKQTLKLDADAVNECRRLLLYSLMLKFYKEDAQVYNDMCMYDQTVKLLGEAIEICDSLKNDGMKGELYNLLSIAESSENHLNGKTTALKAVELNVASKSIIEQGKAYLALGTALYREQDYASAYDAFSKSMELFEQAGYKSGQARSEHELAKVFYREGKKEEALSHIERSRRLLVRDYGITHRIYEYKNRVVENLVKGIPFSKESFKDCPAIEFVKDQNEFITSYSSEV